MATQLCTSVRVQYGTVQCRIGQNRTGQDRTGQDRTGQNRTGQDRIDAPYSTGVPLNALISHWGK
jgi:hypothetical protein